MANNRLAIIVLNWNCADDSIKCIDSLRSQEGVEVDIILVDNASSDDSVQRLGEYIASLDQPSIQLIENDSNLGFGGGINSGLEVALDKQYDYIALLNPDAVADSRWIAALKRELDEHPDSAIAGGLMLHKDGKTIDGAGDQYTIWGLPGPRGRNQPASEAPRQREYFFGATGGGMMIRSSALRNIGLFDEKYFMYYEDVDLSFRTQLAGYKVRYTPDAIAYHAQGSSTKKVPGLAVYNTFKNTPMLYWKNVPLRLFPKILPRFGVTYLMIAISAILKGNGWPMLKGWVMSLWLIPHTLAERKRIQSAAKVSADYIDSIILQDIPADQTGLRKLRKMFTGKS